MIAFEHNITAPFLDEIKVVDSYFPKLSAIKVNEAISNLENLRIFNQNQKRDVLLSTNFSFDDNITGQQWTFDVKDVVVFYWKKDSNVIEFHEGKEGSSALSKYWFLHTFLPIYFTVEKKFELMHAASVQINSNPILFIAPSYGGKSTLTDYFIKKDHVMISDDRVGFIVKNDKAMIISSYEYHRPYRKMEDLGVKVNNFMYKSKALHLIYVLKSTDPKSPVSFQEIKGVEKFKALQYGFDFKLPLNKVAIFELIAKISSIVEVHQVNIPWDLNRLEDVYQAICVHSKTKEVSWT